MDQKRACETCSRWERLPSATHQQINTGTCPVHGFTTALASCASYDPKVVTLRRPEDQPNRDRDRSQVG